MFSYKKVFKSAWRNIRQFKNNVKENILGAITLMLASLGVASIISPLMYNVVLPSIFNPEMVVPAISVAVIGLLIKGMKMQVSACRA